MSYHDISIRELVDQMKRGDIRLPEMQRGYVWKSTQVRDLLDSLYRGYPSGTILTWQTDDPVETRDPAIKQTGGSVDRYQLLLDGQQRLTSMAAVLNGDLIRVKKRVRPIDILFNLNHPDDPFVVSEVHEGDEDEINAESSDIEEDDLQSRFDRMAFVVKTKKLANLPLWVSVTDIFKSDDNMKFLQRAGVDSLNDPNLAKWNKRLNRLRGIAEYSYRVNVLERTKSYEEVTEIFVRVNSLGTKLRGADLALAQITAKWPGSLAQFEEFQSGCKFDLDISTHIKNLIAFATGQSRFKTVDSLSRGVLEYAWNECKDGMNYAVDFIKNNAEIDDPFLLASPFILITIAYYAHCKNYALTGSEAEDLKYWTMLANAKARYSRGSTETFLDQDLRAVRSHNQTGELLRILRAQVGRLDVLPDDLENRNTRSAYFKVMFMAFRAAEAEDWRNRIKIALKSSGRKLSLQFHHIFPKSHQQEIGCSQTLINDIANMAFISGKTNRWINNRKPCDYLPCLVSEIGEDELEKQCIPGDRKLWELNSYEEFLRQRRILIADRLNEYLKIRNDSSQ